MWSVSKTATRSTLPDMNSCQCTLCLPRGDIKKIEIFITYSHHYCHFINMLQAYHNFFEWFTLSFDLNIYFREVFHLSNRQRLQWSIQSAWLNFILFSVLNSQSQAFSSMKATHKQILLVHPRTLRPDYNGCSSALHQQMTNSLSFPQWTVLSGFSMNFPFFSSLSDVQLLLSTPSYSQQFIATYWQLRPLWWTSICRLQRGLHPESG